MLLKTDWVAIVIAVLGTGVVTYYGWASRNENPMMKKLIYVSLASVFTLLVLCAYMTIGANG